MLLKYKKAYEKIAMGLISLATHERDVKKLRELVLRYEQEPNFELFLWKVEEDFVGVIGVEHLSEEQAQVLHVGVNPSMRRLGLGKQMVCTLKEKLAIKTLTATKETQEFLSYCLLEKHVN
ncbi:MAG: GNAT family N-acetyltransferase [Bacilli bacterium]